MMVTPKQRGFLHGMEVGPKDPKAPSSSKAPGTSPSVLSQRATVVQKQLMQVRCLPLLPPDAQTAGVGV